MAACAYYPSPLVIGHPSMRSPALPNVSSPNTADGIISKRLGFG